MKRDTLVKRCENCNRKYYQIRHWQKFCSDMCRWEKWEKENPRIKLNELHERVLEN